MFVMFTYRCDFCQLFKMNHATHDRALSFRDRQVIDGSCFVSAAVLIERRKHLLLDVLGRDSMICSRISILLFWLILLRTLARGSNCHVPVCLIARPTLET